MKIDPESKMSERLNQIKQFSIHSDQIDILSSCRTISEGIDVPCHPCIALIDPRKSYVDIVQMIGRGSRVKTAEDKKKINFVFVPIYLTKSKYQNLSTPEEQDKVIREQLAENGDFNVFLNVCSALRQEDPELYELCLKYPDVFTKKEMAKELKKQNFKLGETKSLLEAIEEQCDGLNKEDYQGMDDRQIMEEISNHVAIDYLDNKIDAEPERLGDKKDTNPIRIAKTPAGYCSIQPVNKKEKKSLSKLDTKEAKEKRTRKFPIKIHNKNYPIEVFCNLTPKLIADKMEMAILDFVVNGKADNDEVWEEKRQQVIKFVKENGKLPTDYKKNNEFEKKLGSWVCKQKASYKGNKNGCKMTNERIKLLEEIPGWIWEVDLDSIWEEKRQNVINFVKENNKFPSVHSINHEEKSLGYWITNQRTSYKGKGRCKMTKKRIKLLEEIPGWVWEIDLDSVWEEKRQKVINFVKEKTSFPNRYSTNKEEKYLGGWISKQKESYKGKGGYSITDERIKLLEEIPGWVWEVDLDYVWEEKRQNVIKFVKEKNKFPSVNSINHEEKSLGIWITTQKAANKGKGGYSITDERIKLLEEIPGWVWEVDLDYVWEEKRQKLITFIKKHNKFPISTSKNEEEKSLYGWIGNQRNAYKGNNNGCKMTKERIKLLEEIPGWIWEVDLDSVWEEKRQKVLKFVKENNVLPNRLSKNKIEKSLASWINTQRLVNKGKVKGKMTQEKFKLLEEIPGWKWENNFDDIWDEKRQKDRKFSNL